MPESTLISIRLPNDLLNKLDQRVEELKLTSRGMNRTYLMIDALEQILGITSNDAVLLSNTALDDSDIDQKIEDAIAPLRAELDALKSQIDQIASSPIAATSKQRSTTLKVKSERPVEVVEHPTCTNCGSNDTKYRGRGQLRKDGTRNYRYDCLNCKKTFAIDKMA